MLQQSFRANSEQHKHSEPPINQVLKRYFNFFGLEMCFPRLCRHSQWKSCGERDSPVTGQEWGVGAAGSEGFPHLGAGGVSERMPKGLVNATGTYFASPMKNLSD